MEKFFDEREAAKYLKDYHKHGPRRMTRDLIEAIKAEGIEGRSLLDIGGGIGAIQHELLKAGATSSVAVEASTAHVQALQQEAQRQGHEERITVHHGDFVDIAEDVQQADIVTLDRVICCYHDLESLVGLSSERAAVLYGLIYPRATWPAMIAVVLFKPLPPATTKPFPRVPAPKVHRRPDIAAQRLPAALL